MYIVEIIMYWTNSYLTVVTQKRCWSLCTDNRIHLHASVLAVNLYMKKTKGISCDLSWH